MRTLVALLPLLVATIVAGCAGPDKQWMKVGESYTTAEFRRDYAACTKNGRLDEDCMRARGWVDMAPSKGDRAADNPPTPPPQYSRPPSSQTSPTRR
jgi:hypothetical protein